MCDTPQLPLWRTLFRFISSGDRQVLQDLRQAAASLRQQGNHFAAAFAMDRATYAAWGDPHEMQACALEALQDYRHVYDTSDPCALSSLIAILLMVQLYWRHYLFRPAGTDPKQRASELLGELAQRLVTCFQASPDRDNYLVRGVIVETDLVERFEAQLTEYEVDWGTTTGSEWGVQFRLPSAFTLFGYLDDYDLARQVIDLCPDAFTTPGLRGWKAAVRGFVDPSSAPESFGEAADAFAEDRPPETDDEFQRRGGHWDNMNIATWAPYFRVRSLLATAVREPGRVRELIARAAEVADPEAGGCSAPNVRRLALLVRALAELLGDEATIDVEAAQKEFLMVSRVGGADEGDAVAVRFLTLAVEAFEGFRQNPAAEITTGRLPAALDALRRLPLLEPGLTDAVGPAIGEQALHLAQGPIRTWMHRTLEAITDERHLQHIIFRLSQASAPLYALVLHGPLEYGKDVVVHFERGGRRVLRMYQAKVGDISLTTWREVRAQLEEMFLVPLPDFVIPAEPAPEREGILICNGHALPHAFPPMQGWFESQRRDQGRAFEFMCLDDVVQWIVSGRLVNDLRAALRERGIPVDIR